MTEEIKQLEQPDNKTAEDIRQLEQQDNNNTEEKRQLEQPDNNNTDENKNLEKSNNNADDNERKLLNSKTEVLRAKNENNSVPGDNLEIQCDSCVLEKESHSMDTVVQPPDSIVSNNNGFPIDTVIKQCCDHTVSKDDAINESDIKQMNDCVSEKKHIASENLTNLCAERGTVDRSLSTSTHSSVESCKDNVHVLLKEDSTNEILETCISKKEVLSSSCIDKHCSDTVTNQDEFQENENVGINGVELINNIPDTDCNAKDGDTLANEGNCKTIVSESICDKGNVPNVTQTAKEKEDPFDPHDKEV